MVGQPTPVPCPLDSDSKTSRHQPSRLAVFLCHFQLERAARYLQLLLQKTPRRHCYTGERFSLTLIAEDSYTPRPLVPTSHHFLGCLVLWTIQPPHIATEEPNPRSQPFTFSRDRYAIGIPLYNPLTWTPLPKSPRQLPTAAARPYFPGIPHPRTRVAPAGWIA